MNLRRNQAGSGRVKAIPAAVGFGRLPERLAWPTAALGIVCLSILLWVGIATTIARVFG